MQAKSSPALLDAEKEFFILQNRRQGSIHWLSAVALIRKNCVPQIFPIRRNCVPRNCEAQKLRTHPAAVSAELREPRKADAFRRSMNDGRNRYSECLSTIPRLILHNRKATGSGSVAIAFHQDSSSPVWWFSRW